jgi:hypothetical protein
MVIRVVLIGFIVASLAIAGAVQSVAGPFPGPPHHAPACGGCGGCNACVHGPASCARPMPPPLCAGICAGICAGALGSCRSLCGAVLSIPAAIMGGILAPPRLRSGCGHGFAPRRAWAPPQPCYAGACPPAQLPAYCPPPVKVVAKCRTAVSQPYYPPAPTAIRVAPPSPSSLAEAAWNSGEPAEMWAPEDPILPDFGYAPASFTETPFRLTQHGLAPAVQPDYSSVAQKRGDSGDPLFGWYW